MQFSLIFTLLSSKSFWCFIFCTLKPCSPKNKDDTSVILKRKRIFSFIKLLHSNMIMSKRRIFQVLYFPYTQIGILISKGQKVAAWDNVLVWRKHAFSCNQTCNLKFSQRQVIYNFLNTTRHGQSHQNTFCP